MRRYWLGLVQFLIGFRVMNDKQENIHSKKEGRGHGGHSGLSCGVTGGLRQKVLETNGGPLWPDAGGKERGRGLTG